MVYALTFDNKTPGNTVFVRHFGSCGTSNFSTISYDAVKLVKVFPGDTPVLGKGSLFSLKKSKFQLEVTGIFFSNILGYNAYQQTRS